MRRPPSASELFAWTLVGAVVGLVGGVALGEWIGPVNLRRAERGLARFRTGRESEPGIPLKAAETARAARLAVERDTELRGLGLEPIAVGPGVVELHGWVPTRALRARAARVVTTADGIDTLVNCILVHGEDDAAHAALDPTDQTA
jgi:hypothetical protein